jgi:hypothetical protein
MHESDAVKIWTLVITAFVGIVTPLVGSVCAWLLWKTRQGQTEAANLAVLTEAKQDTRTTAVAQKVAEVKQQLTLSDSVKNDKLDALADTADATHTLVNGQMGVTLKAAAVALRVVADLRKEPGDVDAAVEAERKYADHMAKQAKVDAAKSPPPCGLPVANPPRPIERPGSTQGTP